MIKSLLPSKQRSQGQIFCTAVVSSCSGFVSDSKSGRIVREMSSTAVMLALLQKDKATVHAST